MVLIQSYARTGSRSWNIGGEKVSLKPFRGRRSSFEPEKPKPEPDNRRKSMIDIPPKPHNPQNSKADYTVQLIPDSPPIIQAGLPPKPAPVRKNAKSSKFLSAKFVEVSFTFVIGGYQEDILE